MFKRCFSNYGNEYVAWCDWDVYSNLVERKNLGENIYIPSGRSARGLEYYSNENPVKLFWDYDDFVEILGVTKGTLYRFNGFLKKKYEETKDQKFDIYYQVEKTGDRLNGIKTVTMFSTYYAHKFCMLYVEMRKPVIEKEVQDVFEPWKELLKDDELIRNGGRVLGRVAY